MTNSSHAYLSISAISWHLFHVIHLPPCTSMIRGEIEVFIILFLCTLLVVPHLSQHTRILMAIKQEIELYLIEKAEKKVIGKKAERNSSVSFLDQIAT